MPQRLEAVDMDRSNILDTESPTRIRMSPLHPVSDSTSESMTNSSSDSDLSETAQSETDKKTDKTETNADKKTTPGKTVITGKKVTPGNKFEMFMSEMWSPVKNLFTPDEPDDWANHDTTTRKAVVITSCALAGASLAAPAGMVLMPIALPAALVGLSSPMIAAAIGSSVGGLMGGSFGWAVDKAVDKVGGKNNLTETEIHDFLSDEVPSSELQPTP